MEYLLTSNQDSLDFLSIICSEELKNPNNIDLFLLRAEQILSMDNYYDITTHNRKIAIKKFQIKKLMRKKRVYKKSLLKSKVASEKPRYKGRFIRYNIMDFF